MLKGLLRRVGKGIFDGTLKPVLNTAKGVVTNFTKDNIESDEGGKGKVDWVRLATALVTLAASAYLLWQFLSGEKTAEEVEDGLKLIETVGDIIQ